MKWLSLALITLVSVSCGKKPEEKTEEKNNPRKVTSTRESANPITLKSSANKSACASDGFSDIQRNISLSLFIHDAQVDEDRYFDKLLDGLFVRDVGAEIITDSHKNQSLLYTYVSTDGVITSDEKELSPPETIQVCPDSGKYERGTAESAALNATYFISKTNRMIKKLMPELRIDPISVEVAPMIKKSLSIVSGGEVIWSADLFETDNAYYAPGTNSITFLPHSQEFRDAGITLNFWEVPMVSAHEYGHHIFHSIHPEAVGPEGIRNCFGKFGFQSEATLEEKREVTNDDVLGALNEGFADLVSYYSLDNQERGLKGVRCLEVARDVGSKAFADGSAKAFSATALSTFFSDKEIEGPSMCEVPNFQDIHIVGAVFANGADRLLSLSADTKEERLSIVLNWLREMQNRSQDLSRLGPQDFLRESVKLLVETAVARTDGKLDQPECDVIRDFYPGLDGYLTACMPPI